MTKEGVGAQKSYNRLFLGLNREKLILMAMLTGCDYTAGVENVGVVSALEILSEFGQKKEEGVEPLVRFRDWWKDKQTNQSSPGTETKARLQKLACTFPPSFPDFQVFEAYLKVRYYTHPNFTCDYCALFVIIFHLFSLIKENAICSLSSR